LDNSLKKERPHSNTSINSELKYNGSNNLSDKDTLTKVAKIQSTRRKDGKVRVKEEQQNNLLNSSYDSLSSNNLNLSFDRQHQESFLDNLESADHPVHTPKNKNKD